MFRTLYSRIAAVLFSLVIIIGYVVYSMVLYSAEMYQQELTQKLNATLATHIVSEEPLFMGQDVTKQQINQTALKSLFHWLMVVNPSIEVYLLDLEGTVVQHSAPPGRVSSPYHLSLYSWSGAREVQPDKTMATARRLGSRSRTNLSNMLTVPNTACVGSPVGLVSG